MIVAVTALLFAAAGALGWNVLRLRRQLSVQAVRARALEARRQDGLETERELAGEVDRLRRAERDLRESEEFNRALFQATQTGLMIVNTASKQIMEVNGAGAAVLGCAADDVIGDLADRYLPCPTPGDCPALAENGFHNRSLEFRRRDGTLAPVLCSVTRLSRDDAGLVVVSFLDISEQQENERKLIESNRQLEQVNDLLKAHKDQIVQSEKLASIGQLAAGVAHEINNPIDFVTSNLATIQEYADTMGALLGLYLRRDALDESDRGQRGRLTRQIQEISEAEDLAFILDDLESVMRESMTGLKRVADIVQNLRSFARSDGGDRQPHDIHDGIEAMIGMVTNELKRPCRVERRFGDIPVVKCHPGRINQVIMNMLINAGQALGEAGGTITVATGLRGDELEISIADTGRGIPPETLPRIFDPFFTTKDVGQGTGLGLSISHGIILEHGGRIEVDSELGLGTEFRIYLPLAGCPVFTETE